jgi:MatE
MERHSFSSFIERSFGPMKDLTQGSVTRHLLHVSAFLSVSMVVQTLYLLADLYWVGHLGKEAIAAIGVAGNMTMIVLALTPNAGCGNNHVDFARRRAKRTPVYRMKRAKETVTPPLY